MKQFRNAECGLRNGPTLTLVLALALGFLAAPLAAEAQQAGKPSRVGILPSGPISGLSHLWEAFRQGLRELGYVEGKNIALEFPSTEVRSDRLVDVATELVRLKVDVIVAGGTPAAQAAKQATTTVPIVIVGVADPVSTKLIASLARPGGNITGLANITPDIGGKRLQLLKEVIPRVSRVAILSNPATPYAALVVRETEIAARTLGVQLQSLEVRGPNDFEIAFGAAIRGRAGALITVEDPLTLRNRAQIVALAAKNQLPTIYGFREFVDAGGLMSYAANLSDMYRRAATFVDKILNGAKPADLPVEQPTKIELVINLKTAKALGLKIPQSILIRADQVIQ